MVAVTEAAEVMDLAEVTDSPVEAMATMAEAVVSMLEAVDSMVEAVGPMVEVVDTTAEDTMDTTEDTVDTTEDIMATMGTADTIGIMGITGAGRIRGCPVLVGGIRGTMGIRVMGIPITTTIPITGRTIAIRITVATIGIAIPIIIGTIVTLITVTAINHTRGYHHRIGFGPTVLHVSEVDIGQGASSSADRVNQVMTARLEKSN